MAVEGGGDYRQRLVQRQLQRKKRKQAGLENSRADAGPPSSTKTFSSPPERKGPNVTRWASKGVTSKDNKYLIAPFKAVAYATPNVEAIARGVTDPIGTAKGVAEIASYTNPYTLLYRGYNAKQGDGFTKSLFGGDSQDIEQALEIAGIIPYAKAAKLGKAASYAAPEALDLMKDAARRLGTGGYNAASVGIKPMATQTKASRKTASGTFENKEEGDLDVTFGFEPKTISPDGTAIRLEVHSTGKGGSLMVSPRVARAMGVPEEAIKVSDQEFEETGYMISLGKTDVTKHKKALVAGDSVGANVYPYLNKKDFNITAQSGVESVQNIYGTKLPVLGRIIGKENASMNEVLDHFGISKIVPQFREISDDDVAVINQLYEDSYGIPALRGYIDPITGKPITPNRDHAITKSGHAWQDVDDFTDEMVSWIKDIRNGRGSYEDMIDEMTRWVDQRQEHLDAVLDPKYFILLDAEANQFVKHNKDILSFLRTKTEEYAARGSSFTPIQKMSEGYARVNPTLVAYRDTYERLIRMAAGGRFESDFINNYSRGLGKLIRATRSNNPDMAEKARQKIEEYYTKKYSEDLLD